VKRILAELDKYHKHLEELVEHRTVELQREVNDRRRIEVQLEASNKQLVESQLHLQTIFDGAIIGTVLLNYETGVSLCNPAFQQMLGYSENELKSMSFREFTYHDDLAKELELFQKVSKSKADQYQLEKRYIRKDKSILWGRLSIRIIRNSLGKIEYIIGMVEELLLIFRIQEYINC